MHKTLEDDFKNIINQDLPWQHLKSKTVLITGANGFLPTYLVFTLLKLNDLNNHKIKVIGLVRNEKKANLVFKDVLNRVDFNLIIQDVSQPIQLQNKVHFIIHAASQASPKYYGIDPTGTLKANTIGTYHLLNLAKNNEVEGFLFFSSSEVYGKLGQKAASIEEYQFGPLDPMNVRNCYAESKRMGENMCVSWYHQFKIPTKIVRPFHTYGPGMSLDDGRVYADFVANIVRNENILLNSDGSARRAFCYLADATVGFFTILLKGQSGEAYNVGNPTEEHSIYELGTALVKLFPEKKLSITRKIIESNDTYLKSKINRNCPNISKINALGWFPTTSISEGFYKTISTYL